VGRAQALHHRPIMIPRVKDLSMSSDSANKLKQEVFDADKLAERGFFNERLDQLAIDHILGLKK